MEILTRYARDRKDVTPMELSELTGISKSALNNIEKGKV